MFGEISHFVLMLTSNFKKGWDIFSNFVVFLQYLNFTFERIFNIRARFYLLKPSDIDAVFNKNIFFKSYYYLPFDIDFT